VRGSLDGPEQRIRKILHDWGSARPDADALPWRCGYGRVGV